MLVQYQPHISELSAQSQTLALQLEIGAYYDDEEEIVAVVPGDSDNDENELEIRAHPGINNEADAWHGTRKNTKDTSVFVLVARHISACATNM